MNLSTRPHLSLATPAGSQTAVPEVGSEFRSQSQSIQGSFEGFRSRADSFQNPSMPGSAASSAYSGFSYPGHGPRQTSTPDPGSAISSVYSEGIGGTSMEREGSIGGLSIDFEKISLEKGRPVDVEDLDDEGWAAASEQKKIIELGALGEGSGGAVTRCMLDGGKTVFALKVCFAEIVGMLHQEADLLEIITTSPDPDVKKQILRELKFNKNCMSDYICQYYGAFMDKSSSTISIAMEFCEGGSLDSVYREVKKLGGRTGEKVLGKVAEGVLHGLTYLNSRKIIHRGM